MVCSFFYACLLWSMMPRMGIAYMLQTSETTLANQMINPGHYSGVEKWIPDASDVGLEKFWGDIEGRNVRVLALTLEGEEKISRNFWG